MSENKKSEKDDYLTKDEMMGFLKSKGIIIDPKTRNFLRFAKSNGIIYKIVERVGSAGHAPAVYKKPNKDKIIEILKKLQKTNNSLVGRKIAQQKKKMVISIFNKLENKEDRPKEEKIFRTNIADQIVKKLKINTNPKFVVRSLNNEFSESLINKKLNTTKKEKS